jgi:hypothetical protein
MVDMFIVDGQNVEDVEIQLVNCENSLSNDEEDRNTGYALVINGHSLVYALQTKLEKLFLDVGTQCKSGCRKFPLATANNNTFSYSFRQSGDLLPCNSPSKGHGGRFGQKVQTGRDALYRRWSQRRFYDQNGSHRRRYQRPGRNAGTHHISSFDFI